jgi:cytochrome c556
MKKLLMIGLAVCMGFGAVTASQAGPMENAVKARRAYYQVILSNAGPLFAVMKGRAKYDAKAAQTYANNLKLITQVNNAHLWPKGSDNTNAALKGQTRALPAIWGPSSDLSAKGKALRVAAAELAADAGKGKDALVAKLKNVGVRVLRVPKRIARKTSNLSQHRVS